MSEINWMQRILIGKVGKDITDPNFKNVRVDNQTPLGNPYVLNVQERTQEVVDLYASYLDKCINDHAPLPVVEKLEEIFELLEEGYYVNLQCFHPESPNHAEVIRKELIDALEGNEVIPKELNL